MSERVNPLAIDYRALSEKLVAEQERRAREKALRELEGLLGVLAHVEHRRAFPVPLELRTHQEILATCVNSDSFKSGLPIRILQDEYRNEVTALQVEPYAGFINAVKALQAELEGWRNGSHSTDNSPALGGQKPAPWAYLRRNIYFANRRRRRDGRANLRLVRLPHHGGTTARARPQHPAQGLPQAVLGNLVEHPRQVQP